MKIKNIKIEKLFDIFDYDIKLDNPENLYIITGPNGFGKTMILNVIDNLFNNKILFFVNLVFKTITINTDFFIISILKNDYKKIIVNIKDLKGSSLVEEDVEFDTKIFQEISKYTNLVYNYELGIFTDIYNESTFNLDEILKLYGDNIPTKIKHKIQKVQNKKIQDILVSLKVYYIKEQRLYHIKNTYRNFRKEENTESVIVNSLHIFSKKLKVLLNENIQNSFKITQKLDSTYLDRLISEKKHISENDYNNRLDKLNELQKKLEKYGLSESNQISKNYSELDSKALLVYIDDLEIKLNVFLDILKKLDLFTEILNERRFTFKKIKIDKTKGFYFVTNDNKELSLNQLSSGEQHEVVLLFELIFNVNEDVLVLIDEPEISLHVTWQKEFINDILKIIQNRNIQVIIATHSPSIINENWNLVYNLES